MKSDQTIAYVPFFLLAVILIIGIARGGQQAVSALADGPDEAPGKCFVIDAGHGGEDGGATSCTGVLESQINLEITLRLEPLLRFLGRNTLSIRKTDTAIYTQGTTLAQKKVSDLKERVRIVNETPNAVLISIHQNTFPAAQYSGAQVFYAPTSLSQELARTVQEDLVRTLNPGSNRKCKHSTGIYLMQHIERPGILIECGFLSNPEEEARLRDPAYQKRLCCTVAASLCRFEFA